MFAEKLVEFVRGLEFLLEFFARELGAKMVYGLRDAVERARNVIFIREQNIPPDGVRAAREPQRILKAGPRQATGKPVSSVSSCTTRARATATSCGRCETIPTAQSCVSASHQEGSAPIAPKHARKFCTRSLALSSAPIKTYGAPRNRSASACSTPECSLPAIGCPPRNCAPPLEILVRHFADHGFCAACVRDQSAGSAAAAIAGSASIVATIGSAT